MKKWLVFLLCCFLIPSAFADPIRLKSGHPVRYTVKPGDTLWGIASKFLADPGDWPRVYRANPQISNPNRIYPGEVLELTMHNGRPSITVKGGGVVKLSPTVRSKPVKDAIPAVPMDTIRPFMNSTVVMNDAQFKNAPIVLAPGGEHIVVGVGDKIYVENLKPTSNTEFSIYRKGRPYFDPNTKNLLGYQATYVGEGRLVRTGNPATMDVTASTGPVSARSWARARW